MVVTSGVDGTYQVSPIPYDVIVPKKTKCTNLTVPFCLSATHIAHSSIRMEFASMTLAQATGLAAAIL